MIVISASFFVPLFTWHIALGIDLPPLDFKKSFGPLTLEISTGPKSRAVPVHSVQLSPTTETNPHATPDPAASVWS